MAAWEKPPLIWAAARCQVGCSVPSASQGQPCLPARWWGAQERQQDPPMEENLGCRGCPGFRCLIPPAPSFSTPCWGQAWPWAPAGIWGSAPPPPPGILPPGGVPSQVPERGLQGHSVASSPCRMAGHPRGGDAGCNGAGRDLGATQASPDGRYVGCVAAATGAGGRSAGTGSRSGEESEVTRPELI